MRTILGILLMIGGVFLGLYVGVWLMFVGGIAQVVNAVQMDPIPATAVGVGLLRVAGASVTGVLTFFICTFAGALFVESDN